MGKLPFFGVCDKLRAKSNQNEMHWREMIDNQKPFPVELFIQQVDATNFCLDDDEEIRYWISDNFRQDPESGSYESMWGKERVLFFQTAGFEFIFKTDNDG